jgi:hypothetical protein
MINCSPLSFGEKKPLRPEELSFLGTPPLITKGRTWQKETHAKSNVFSEGGVRIQDIMNSVSRPYQSDMMSILSP